MTFRNILVANKIARLFFSSIKKATGTEALPKSASLPPLPSCTSISFFNAVKGETASVNVLLYVDDSKPASIKKTKNSFEDVSESIDDDTSCSM